MQLRLTTSHRDEMAAEAMAKWPEECCGILIGTQHDDGWSVSQVVCVPNVWDGPRENRFMLDPLAYIREEKRAQADGQQVIGFFHSHPNGVAVPSPFDADLAWPDTAFAIVPIGDRQAGPLRCWCLPDGSSEFVEVEISITST